MLHFRLSQSLCEICKLSIVKILYIFLVYHHTSTEITSKETRHTQESGPNSREQKTESAIIIEAQLPYSNLK